MILVYAATGKEVKIGDKVTGHNGLSGTVYSVEAPHRVGSTGRVHITENDEFSRSVFPAVIGACWVETEEDV